jgi:hypothetical protein
VSSRAARAIGVALVPVAAWGCRALDGRWARAKAMLGG